MANKFMLTHRLNQGKQIVALGCNRSVTGRTKVSLRASDGARRAIV